MLFKIQCATCRSTFAVHDASLIGQIIACPKCGSMILVEDITSSLDTSSPETLSQETSSPAPSAPPLAAAKSLPSGSSFSNEMVSPTSTDSSSSTVEIAQTVDLLQHVNKTARPPQAPSSNSAPSSNPVPSTNSAPSDNPVPSTPTISSDNPVSSTASVTPFDSANSISPTTPVPPNVPAHSNDTVSQASAQEKYVQNTHDQEPVVPKKSSQDEAVQGATVQKEPPAVPHPATLHPSLPTDHGGPLHQETPPVLQQQHSSLNIPPVQKKSPKTEQEASANKISTQESKGDLKITIDQPFPEQNSIYQTTDGPRPHKNDHPSTLSNAESLPDTAPNPELQTPLEKSSSEPPLAFAEPVSPMTSPEQESLSEEADTELNAIPFYQNRGIQILFGIVLALCLSIGYHLFSASASRSASTLETPPSDSNSPDPGEPTTDQILSSETPTDILLDESPEKNLVIGDFDSSGAELLAPSSSSPDSESDLETADTKAPQDETASDASQNTENSGTDSVLPAAQTDSASAQNGEKKSSDAPEATTNNDAHSDDSQTGSDHSGDSPQSDAKDQPLDEPPFDDTEDQENETPESNYDMTASITETRSPDTLPTLKGTPPKLNIPERLQTKIKSVTFPQNRLSEILPVLTGLTDIPIVLDLDCFELLRQSAVTAVDFTWNDITVDELLKQLADSLKLAIQIEEEQIVLTAPDLERTTTLESTFDVSDLVSSTETSPDPSPASSHFLSPEITPDELERLVVSLISPESWSSQGGAGTLSLDKGTLTVTQTEQNRREIEKLLDQLRCIRQLPPQSGLPNEFLIPELLGWEKLSAKMTLNYLEPASFAEIQAILSRTQQLHILVDTAALKDQGVSLETTSQIRVTDSTVARILNQWLTPLHLTYHILAEDLIYITSLEKSQHYQTTEIHILVQPDAPEMSRETMLSLIRDITSSIAPESWEIVDEPTANSWNSDPGAALTVPPVVPSEKVPQQKNSGQANSLPTSELSDSEQARSEQDSIQDSEPTEPDSASPSVSDMETTSQPVQNSATKDLFTSTSTSSPRLLGKIWADPQSGCLIIRQNQPNQRAIRQWIDRKIFQKNEGNDAAASEEISSPDPTASESATPEPAATEATPPNPAESESTPPNPAEPESTPPNPAAPESTPPNPAAPESATPEPAATEATPKTGVSSQ